MAAPALTDLIVRTGNVQMLSDTLAQLPMADASVVPGSWNEADSTCRVRVVGGFNTGFVKYALTNQGYGTVLGEEPVP